MVLLDAPAPMDLSDRWLGRYRLASLIGRGGMASVYSAHLPGAHGVTRRLAIKVIHEHLVDEERFRHMFIDEARVAARIEHPNVGAVLDFGEADGLVYLVMEFLDGPSLAQVMHRVLQSEPFPIAIAVRIASDAARGLHAAHVLKDDHGSPLHVVHRDVSPHNLVLLYDGVTKVVDFGVAKTEGQLTVSISGEVKGKLAYMAPEYLRGKEFDARADVWSLGALLWEMVAGTSLFARDTQVLTMAQVLERPIPSLREFRPDCPAHLDAAILRALERDLARRTPSAKALLLELEDLVEEGSIPAASTTRVAAFMADHFPDRVLPPSRKSTPAPYDVEIIGADLPATTGSSHDTELRTPTSVWPGGSSRFPSRRSFLVAVATISRSTRRGSLVLLASIVLGGGLGWLGLKTAEEPTVVTPTQQPPRPIPSRVPASNRSSIRENISALPSTNRDEREASRTKVAVSSLEDTSHPIEDRRALLPAVGRLRLMSFPSSFVTWRGRALGETPITDLILPAGRHALHLVPQNDGEPKTITIDIHPGRQTRRVVRFDE